MLCVTLCYIKSIGKRLGFPKTKDKRMKYAVIAQSDSGETTEFLCFTDDLSNARMIRDAINAWIQLGNIITFPCPLTGQDLLAVISIIETETNGDVK